MDRIVQKLRQVTDAKRQLILEYASLKSELASHLALHDDSIIHTTGTTLTSFNRLSGRSRQDLQKCNGDERIELLCAKILELEKRCALQQLRHEEVLLELEDAKKRSRLSDLATTASANLEHDGLHSAYKSDFDLAPSAISSLLSKHLEETNLLEDGFMNPTSSTEQLPQLTSAALIKGRMISKMSDSSFKSVFDPNLVELFQTADESLERNDIPAPRMITLERQLVHSVLISWKPPENVSHTVSAYHVYVDGQFRMSVKSREKTRALLDNVDADKPHRISVRSICTKGQSKDAECTLVVGRGMTATPGRLRATQIGTKSAKLSWMPGNSNFWHRVFLNQTELHICPPGVYKVVLTDLSPDTLHSVCVQALSNPSRPVDEMPVARLSGTQSGVDISKLAAFIEFRTLPIGMPDPPTNVQLEPGPQDGMILVTWLPVPQDHDAAATATASGTGTTLPVQGYTVCLNDQSLTEVHGASNDHVLIPLTQIKQCLEHIHGSQEAEHAEDNAHRNVPRLQISGLGDFSHPLFVTVHSTVPCSAMDEISQTNGNKCESQVLKGSGGPASLPVNLTADLLIAAAGSLESAIRIFGAYLASRVGINESASKRAGVPLTDGNILINGSTPTPQPDQVSGRESGSITISANLPTRKSSPTTNAVGMAEALLRARGVLENEESRRISSSPETNQHGKDRAIELKTSKSMNKYQHYWNVEPWPWPVPPPKTSTLFDSITKSKPVSRRSWRQARSMSDEYDPPCRHLQDTISFNFPEDSNDSLVSSDTGYEQTNLVQTHSLNSLYSPRFKKSWKHRGTAKSSSDLRTTGAVNTGRFLSSRLQHRYRPMRDNPVRPYRPVKFPKHIRRTTEHFPGMQLLSRHRYGVTSVPGPIVAAFSSSSTEDKRCSYLSDVCRHGSFNDCGEMRMSQYNVPRSRSTSPYRKTHQKGKIKSERRHDNDIRAIRDSHWATRDIICRTPQRGPFKLNEPAEKPFVPRVHRENEHVTNYSTPSPISRGNFRPTDRNDVHQAVNPDDVRFVVALYTYDPATMSPNPDAVQEELPFQQGQVIRIFGDLDEDGFYLGECNGLHGLVPSNMVSEPETQQVDTTNSIFRSRDEMQPFHDRLNFAARSTVPPGQVIKPGQSENHMVFKTSKRSIPSSHRSVTSRHYETHPEDRQGPRMPANENPKQADGYDEITTIRINDFPTSKLNSNRLRLNDHSVQEVLHGPSTQRLADWKLPVRLPDQPQITGPNSVIDSVVKQNRSSGRPIRREMVALYDYDPKVLSPNADAEMELSFRTGDTVIVYGQMDEDGFYSGELVDGRRGLVPSNFLREPGGPAGSKSVVYDGTQDRVMNPVNYGETTNSREKPQKFDKDRTQVDTGSTPRSRPQNSRKPFE